MEDKTQQQHPDQTVTRPSTPRRVSSQHGKKGTIVQRHPKKPDPKPSPLLSIVQAFQKLNLPVQITLGIALILLLVLPIGGIFTLFILVAVVPNAYIGVNALLAAFSGFIGGMIGFFVGKGAKR
jgi:hypothetical protein